jgi:hypothetical protein
MALPLDGAGSSAGVLESCATALGPVKRNAIALNATRLKKVLGMGALPFPKFRFW